ncbi:MAG: hypothetical protein PHI44_01695, partial [Candidatus Ratteibacteria bacterium]|nr:hypothetical protein [Candidatus Ratteibacteria bacterium]
MEILNYLSEWIGERIHQRKLVVAPYIATQDGFLEPLEGLWCSRPQTNTAHLSLVYKNGVKEDIYLKEAGEREIIVSRRLHNSSGGVVFLKEIGLRIEDIEFGEPPEYDYFYHLENPRIYGKMVILVDQCRTEQPKEGKFDVVAGTKWADPGVVGERIGASPYQPFPAILLSNLQSKTGLVHGSLSQEVFFHNYIVKHTENHKLQLDILSSFKAIDYLELQPEECVEDIWYIGITEEADNLERVFSGYTKVLRDYLPPLYGTKSTNRHTVVWGSWNDGIYEDIDQARIIALADFIKEELPTVEWI